jgi:membrane protease YdiL (CAAX protease family)
MASGLLTGPRASSSTPNPGRRRRVLAGAEVLLAALAVVLDLWLPSLVLVGMAVLSMGARREGPGTLGICRLRRPARDLAAVVGLTLGWTLLQVALLVPLVEHLTGGHQDVSDFAELEGDLGMLLVLVGLSWTLAAVGEEVAFRGYLLSRAREAFGTSRVALAAAVLTSAVLFGLIHTEQGLVGVVLATVDGLFFAWLRLRFASLWASVVAHGTGNTIGMVAFFLVGPVTGLW